MIFEIAMVAMTLPFVGGFIHNLVQDYKRKDEIHSKLLTSTVMVEPTTFVLSPTVALVVELLKQDDGWTAEGKLLSHETGVSISVFQKYNPGLGPAQLRTVKLTVLDEDQKPTVVEFNGHEKGVLISEYHANISRRVDRRKREVTAALAKRIIAREKGELQPLLGGSGVPLLPAPDNDDSQPVSVEPAGLLTYDVERQQVVAIGGRGSERMSLDVSLERRYRELLGRAEKKHNLTYNRLMEELKYAY